MKRTDWKYLIDALLFICIVIIAFIGFLMGLVLGRGSNVPESSKYFLGLHRHDWGDIHFYFSIAFTILVIIHLVLSWSWIKGKARIIFKKGWAFQLVLLAMAPFLLLLLIWSFYSGSQTEQSGYGPEGGKRGQVGIIQKELRPIKEEEAKERIEGKSARQKNREEIEASEPAKIQEKLEKGKLEKLLESGEVESQINITGQMSLLDIEKETGIPAGQIAEKLGIPLDVSVNERLGQLRRRYNFTIKQVRDIVASLMKEEVK